MKRGARRTKLVAWCAALLLWSGCGPRTPDKSLILWGQPSPRLAALAHAKESETLGAFEILPTGSMEPYLTGGDWVVGEFAAPFEQLKAGDLVLYDANWLPGNGLVCHMAAAKEGENWIMNGIHNSVYERGQQAMTKGDYRAKVVQVYTKREKK